MRVTVYVFIHQGELLEGHNGVEVDNQKSRGSDDKSRET